MRAFAAVVVGLFMACGGSTGGPAPVPVCQEVNGTLVCGAPDGGGTGGGVGTGGGAGTGGGTGQPLQGCQGFTWWDFALGRLGEAVVYRGVAIDVPPSKQPTCVAGHHAEFTVLATSPLPAGLALDRLTAHIVGTPTTLTPESVAEVIIESVDEATGARVNAGSAWPRLTVVEPVVTTPSAPVIADFSPTQGSAGTRVTLSGTGFGTVASDLTVAFNGVVAPVISLGLMDIVTGVPAGATTGPITVTRGGQTGASSTSFRVGAVMAFSTVFAGGAGTTARVLSLVAVSDTQALVGRDDGSLLRTTDGLTFAPLAYAGGLPSGDNATSLGITGLHCGTTDCLVARRASFNLARLTAPFSATPTALAVASAGPTEHLACGAKAVRECVGLEQAGVANRYVSSSADFAAQPLSLRTATFGAATDFQFNKLHAGPGTATYFLFGLGKGSFPNRAGGLAFSEDSGLTWAVIPGAPGESFGGHCYRENTTTTCFVAQAPGGLKVGKASGALAAMAFTDVPGLPANGLFYDVTCESPGVCTAVGVAQPGLSTQKGLIAQTRNGIDWYPVYYGTCALRRVGCATGTCFIGDEFGAVIKGR